MTEMVDSWEKKEGEMGFERKFFLKLIKIST